MPTLTRRRFVGNLLLSAAGAAMSRATPPAPRWQIGCYTRPWDKFDYRVALDAISEAGFKIAGLMTSKSGMVITPETTLEQAAAMAAEAKSRGLVIASVSGSDFNARKSVADGIAGLKRIIDNTAVCSCPSLHFSGTAVAAELPDYWQAIAECCDYAAAKGVRLNVKPHGGLNATGPLCRRLIEKVDHPNFGLWYDPGNIFYYSDGRIDPVEDAATVDGLVTGMCVKDFLPPKNVMVTPGTGRVDFPKVLARLGQGGFTAGPLLVECLSPGDPAHLVAQAIQARHFLETLTA